MRVAIVLLTGLFLIALAMPVQADHDSFEASGVVLAGSPEPVLAAPCEPGADDPHGVSYDISGFDGHLFNVQPLATLDVDPEFYDADCNFISNGGAQLGFLGALEFGIVPDDAQYLYVFGYAGTGTFDVEI